MSAYFAEYVEAWTGERKLVRDYVDCSLLFVDYEVEGPG